MTPHDFSNRTLDERYSLVRRIGYGGMATVYEAVDLELDKRVAVKVLNPEYTIDDDHMARFRQEARSAAKIRHPHLVDVTDQGFTQDGMAYFVMEYMEGESLGEHIHRMAGPLPWTLVVEIVVQVCSALDVAHDRGIIHRDIKPANCFLEQRRGTGQVVFIKVLDLGIAKVRREDRDARGLPSTRESQGVPGTPEYMAPELARGMQFDRRVDIYALGVMMYRLLTGELPFYSATSPFVTLEMHCNKLPRPPRELNAMIPERIEQIVLTALKKIPEERYSSAGELAIALERAREAEALPPSIEEVRTQQYVRGPAVGTTARRLLHATTALGGFTTAAAMFMILLLVEGPSQTSAAPPSKAAPTTKEPTVIFAEPRESPKAPVVAAAPAGPGHDEARGAGVVAAPAEDPGAGVEAGNENVAGGGADAEAGKEPEVKEPEEAKVPEAKLPEEIPDEAKKPDEPKKTTPKIPKPADEVKPKAPKPPPPSPPPVKGDPDRAMVDGTVSRAKGSINKACKGKLSTFDTKVTVGVSLTLGPSGAISKMAVNPPHNGTHLGTCVVIELGKLAFKKPVGGKPEFQVKIVVQR